MNEPRKIFIPAGIVLAKDTAGREVTIEAILLDPSIVDRVDLRTLTQGGFKFLLEIEECGRRQQIARLGS